MTSSIRRPTPISPFRDLPEADDLHWSAIAQRDPAQDGRFVFAVISTNIYCRPTCPARRPRRENVRIFTTGDEARACGFRACKRCDPDGASSSERESVIVQTVCRAIERSTRTLPLSELATLVSLSPSRLHQVFRAVTGISPWAYSAFVRSRRFQATLATSDDVASAAFEAGHRSVSAAYVDAHRHMHQSPARYRQRGRGETISLAEFACKLGHVGIGISDRGICAIALGDSPSQVCAEITARFSNATIRPASDADAALLSRVVSTVEGSKITEALPLDIRGTAFQIRVWNAISRISHGATATYKELATQIGMPSATRAVAQACAANALAVLVPCHRVIASDGSLAGYRWGAHRKQTLLDLERTDNGLV